MNLIKSNDLYPLKYKNYINSRKFDENTAAVIIQKRWRKYIVVKNLKSVPYRFLSWFGF